MLAERSHMCQLCCKIGSPKQLVEKVIFSQTRPWANKRKYHPQACLGQTGVFLKNNKPKPLMA